jgi:hypothetical protein
LAWSTTITGSPTSANGKLRLADDDCVGVDRIVRLNAERARQIQRLVARRGDAVDRHALEAEQRARHRLDHHEWLFARLDPGRHGGVVIAFGAQQTAEQCRVLACAPVELGCVGWPCVVRVQRRQLIEARAQQATGNVVDSLDPPDITPRRIGIAGVSHRSRVVYRWGEVGPGDADIGQGRERSIRIERGQSVDRRHLRPRRAHRHAGQQGRSRAEAGTPNAKHHRRVLAALCYARQGVRAQPALRHPSS